MQTLQVQRLDPNLTYACGAATGEVVANYDGVPLIASFVPVRVGGALALERLTVSATFHRSYQSTLITAGDGHAKVTSGIRGTAAIGGDVFGSLDADRIEQFTGFAANVADLEMPTAEAVLPTITLHPNQEVTVTIRPHLMIEKDTGYIGQLLLSEIHISVSMIGDLQKSSRDIPF